MRACLRPRGGSVRGLRLWSSLILMLALDGAGRWGLVLRAYRVDRRRRAVTPN